MKRGANGVDEKTRLLRLPEELDEAIITEAKASGLAVAEWIRRALVRATRRSRK